MQVPRSFGLTVKVYWRYFHKGWISATPGLLITCIALFWFNWTWLYWTDLSFIGWTQLYNSRNGNDYNSTVLHSAFWHYTNEFHAADYERAICRWTTINILKAIYCTVLPAPGVFLCPHPNPEPVLTTPTFREKYFSLAPYMCTVHEMIWYNLWLLNQDHCYEHEMNKIM